MSTNLSLRSIMDANKLTGPNFSDWLRNLKIILRQEKKLYVLENELPPEPAQDATNEVWEYYQSHIDDNEQMTCVMLASMSPELQRQHETMNAREIALFQCRMASGTSVEIHVLQMIGYIEKLGQLGYDLNLELSIDLVLQSLTSRFSQFIMNFHMNKKEMSLAELLNMLKTAEGCLKKESSSVLVVGSSSSSKNKGKISKKKNKNKNQKAYAKVAKQTGGVKKKNDKGTCFHCGIAGHWKRNCKSYLASLKEKKLGGTSTSGLFMIEINLSTSVSQSWVLDTGYGSHICNNVQ
ncbi:hypothetical protein K2173_000976 [Erythroxylum novogranatense]|uniref:CCHC-type domain-containing protein n=1 Tax=Erythroxylum novogranatense TaxID=1862640 RepID=A0AAV8TRV6_9ROSI|nr:hypothetical protein K2173_000976 [Erythroxylum novogranatense]